MTFERDWEKIDNLLVAGCTGTEIAGYLGIHPETLYKWAEQDKKMGFSDYLAQKRSKGDSLLKAHQYAKAMGMTDKGDNTLLIWLGKCRLKQKEHSDIQPLNSDSLDKFFETLPHLDTISKLQAEIDELKRQASFKHAPSDEKAEHLGGCSTVGQDFCKHPETDTTNQEGSLWGGDGHRG